MKWGLLELGDMSSCEDSKQILVGLTPYPFKTNTKENKMQVLKTIETSDNEGLMSLMGQTVTFFCGVYIYTGVLVGVNTVEIKLEKAKVVYETGPFNTKDWKEAQALPNAVYIRLVFVESYMVLK
jgi:hypothetical protein